MTLSRKLITSLAALSVGALAATEAAGARMLGAAHRMAHRIAPVASEDLVGETTLRLLERRPEAVTSFEADRGGYLRRSLVNARRDQLRRERARPLVSASDLGEHGLPEPAALGQDVIEFAELHEFRSAVRRDDRPILELMEAGHSERQIAALLDVTRHCVRRSQARIAETAARYFTDAD